MTPPHDERVFHPRCGPRPSDHFFYNSPLSLQPLISAVFHDFRNVLGIRNLINFTEILFVEHCASRLATSAPFGRYGARRLQKTGTMPLYIVTSKHKILD